MKPFDYARPASLAEASALLASGESRLLAGGMTLLPVLKQRLADPDRLVDLSAIGAIAGISCGPDSVTVGAMTRHVEVAAELVAVLPALAALAGGIGDQAVRNRGTIGGSIANSDPAADYPAAVLGLGATIVTDRREIPADDFFRGLFETALDPAEIIVAVRFPIPAAAGYAKFESPASRFALVGVFVAQTASGVRVAVTGAGPCVFRQAAFERALEAEFDANALNGIPVDPRGLNADLHAEAGYRAHLISVMAKRAVARAKEFARGT
jgi:carbon-monoxide dehydrogenase medium subunit